MADIVMQMNAHCTWVNLVSDVLGSVPVATRALLLGNFPVSFLTK